MRGKDYKVGEEAISRCRTRLGIGPFLHIDPDDRPPNIFATRNTLHFATGRQPYVLLQYIRRRKLLYLEMRLIPTSSVRLYIRPFWSKIKPITGLVMLLVSDCTTGADRNDGDRVDADLKAHGALELGERPTRS